MPCPLTTNYTPRDCKAPAGVKRFLITPFSNVTVISPALSTGGLITAITETVPFKIYLQEPEVANWKQNTAADQKNGTSGSDIEVTFKTYGNDPLVNAELELLIKNKLILIAEEMDGTYTILGEEFGLFVATDAFDTGTAFTDFKGDTITLKGRASRKCRNVDSAIIAGLL